MSVYNDAGFLVEAIESILGQSFGDFAFLIAKDGSTDASPGVIDGFAARDPQPGFRRPSRGGSRVSRRAVEYAQVSVRNARE